MVAVFAVGMTRDVIGFPEEHGDLSHWLALAVSVLVIVYAYALGCHDGSLM
jgi:hypothetical protein